MKRAYAVYATRRNSKEGHTYIDSYFENEADAKAACKMKYCIRAGKYIFSISRVLVDERIGFDSIESVQKDFAEWENQI